MLKINFYPVSAINDILSSVEEYKNICEKEGESILNSEEKITGLKFKESDIDAIIAERMSEDYPLTLRASYKYEVKVATIIHELIHRLLHQLGIYDLSVKITEDRGLLSHKVNNLLLYAIWVNLYAKEFADNAVLVESSRRDMYKKEWEWALTQTVDDRRAIFAKLRLEESTEELNKK